MRRDAERPAAPIDERRTHAGGLRADTIEGVIGDEQDLIRRKAKQFGR